MHRVAVKIYNNICNVKNVPTTCFGPFWLGHHQLDSTVRGTILQCIIIISVNVSEGDEISFTIKYGGGCIKWWYHHHQHSIHTRHSTHLITNIDNTQHLILRTQILPNLQNYFLHIYSTKYHRQQPLYNTLELLMMGIVVPETC